MKEARYSKVLGFRVLMKSLIDFVEFEKACFCFRS